MQGEPNALLGPRPTGLIASLDWVGLAVWLFAGPCGQLAPMAAPKA